MKTLREFRIQSKLTQNALAAMLGTTRSQVNLAEKGERRLPEKAAKRFKEMLAATEKISDNPPVTHDHVSEQSLTAALQKFWQAELDEALWQHENLRRKLVELQEKFELLSVQNASHQNAIAAMLADGAPPPEIDYFKSIQKNIYKQLLACDKAARLQDYVNLHLWSEKIKLLEQYVVPESAPSIGNVILDNNALQTSHYRPPAG